MINGKIAGIQTKSGLTQSQVHEIGIYAEQMMNAFSEAIIWLESAATIEIGNNETIDVEIIRNDIARISQKVNNFSPYFSLSHIIAGLKDVSPSA